MEDSLLSVKPTLVRRVSDLFKDGNNNGPQLLFNKTSMQKLRHCCQNIGLFPYLFHSFSNSKSADAYKLYFNFLINRLCEKIFAIYASKLRPAIRCHLNVDACQTPTACQSVINEEIPKNKHKVDKTDKLSRKIGIQRARRQKNTLLTVVIYYVVPVILLSQLIGLIGLLFIGKHTPGFIFLLSALIFLGLVAMKIFLFQKSARSIKNHGKRKVD